MLPHYYNAETTPGENAVRNRNIGTIEDDNPIFSTV